jgi:hypothetical protein
MYLLILGSPRSGTTLLSSMIGTHTDVAMLIEDRTFAIKKLTSKKVLANKLCIPHQIEITKRANHFTNFLRRKLGLIKNYPSSKNNIEDYLALEDAKIICIVRDYRDVVASIMKRGKKDLTVAKGRWIRGIDMMYELSTQYPEKVIVVSYEDLVKNTESILRQLCDFLKISFQEDMLEGYKYNILYPDQKKIDKSRAFKAKQDDSQKNLIRVPEDSLIFYEQLMLNRLKP